jgi:7-cyano-7-deazaguanine reductase
MSNRSVKNKPQIVRTAVPILEVFTNPEPEREYEIEISCPEFTSVCPKTGQPDFGELLITYAPRKACVELKSLKLYLQQFRNTGIFYEAATNKILDDLAKACAPRWMIVVSQWRPRGGIATKVTASCSAKKRSR